MAKMFKIENCKVIQILLKDSVKYNRVYVDIDVPGNSNLRFEIASLRSIKRNKVSDFFTDVSHNDLIDLEFFIKRSKNISTKLIINSWSKKKNSIFV